MLRIFARGGGEAAGAADPAALWFDLESPSEEEERLAETTLGVNVPTDVERAAIEESARFYEENGALFLTATLPGRRDEGPFVSGAVTFVLAQGKLITVRTIRPRAFEIGQGRASARIGTAQTGADVAMALLESAAERLADLLAEATAAEVKLSAEIFNEEAAPPNLRATLRALGRVGAMAGLAHDSLSSLQRLAAYARHMCDRHGLDDARLKVFERDVGELERQAEALQTRLNFLQDAALGLINATQTDVLKALSVATIAFVPPTLVASIFGMNFEGMTWFRADWGPWIGFALMLAAPLALFALAKWRRWF